MRKPALQRKAPPAWLIVMTAFIAVAAMDGSALACVRERLLEARAVGRYRPKAQIRPDEFSDGKQSLQCPAKYCLHRYRGGRLGNFTPPSFPTTKLMTSNPSSLQKRWRTDSFTSPGRTRYRFTLLFR